MEAALIGILGVVLGVILSNIAARFLESVRRRERIQDVATAIRAEVRSHRQRLLLFKAPAADQITERILEAATKGADYTPFVPREAHLRSDRFSKLEAPRKVEMYRDYIAMGAYALELAEQAIGALEDSSVAGLGPGGAGNRRRRR